MTIAVYIFAGIGFASCICSGLVVVAFWWAPRSEKRRLRALELRQQQRAQQQWDMAAARVAARRQHA